MKEIRTKGVKIGESSVKICVPLTANTRTGLYEEASYALGLRPDLIEWRADYYSEDVSIKGILAALKMINQTAGEIPLIFSYRALCEGGASYAPDNIRFEAIKAVMETGLTDIADIELDSPHRELSAIKNSAENNGVYLIISKHFFDETPSRHVMTECMKSMQDKGADIAKLAVMPSSFSDVIELLKAGVIFKSRFGKTPAITVSMSRLGLISRICGASFGSCVTFGAGLYSSAPGQINADKLRIAIKEFDAANIAPHAQNWEEELLKYWQKLQTDLTV